MATGSVHDSPGKVIGSSCRIFLHRQSAYKLPHRELTSLSMHAERG